MQAISTGRDFVHEGVQSATEVAQRIATRLEMRSEVLTALGAVFERWDGKGMPRGLRGEAIPLPARIAHASTYFEIFYHLGGVDAEQQVAHARPDSAFDGAVVEAFLRAARRPGFWVLLQSESVLDIVLALKPGWPAPVAGERELALAFADLDDMKPPYFAGHSRRVAALWTRIGASRILRPRGSRPAARRAPPRRRISRHPLQMRARMRPV
jgi:hypothetical protein